MLERLSSSATKTLMINSLLLLLNKSSNPSFIILPSKFVLKVTCKWNTTIMIMTTITITDMTMTMTMSMTTTTAIITITITLAIIIPTLIRINRIIIIITRIATIIILIMITIMVTIIKKNQIVLVLTLTHIATHTAQINTNTNIIMDLNINTKKMDTIMLMKLTIINNKRRLQLINLLPNNNLLLIINLLLLMHLKAIIKAIKILLEYNRTNIMSLAPNNILPTMALSTSIEHHCSMKLLYMPLKFNKRAWITRIQRKKGEFFVCKEG